MKTNIIGLIFIIWLSATSAIAQLLNTIKDVMTHEELVWGKFQAQGMIVDMKGTVFFSNDARGYALWKSNGNLAEPIPLPGSGELYGISQLTEVNGFVYFITVPKGNINWQLWKSDGTQEGTAMILENNLPGYVINYMRNINGYLFFSAGEREKEEIWKSDGTKEGTMRVDYFPPFSKYYAYWPEFVEIDGISYFGFKDQLWRTDGTKSGTFMIRSFPDVYWSVAGSLAKINNELLFSVDNELWKTNGTEPGTIFVKKFQSEQIYRFIGVNNLLFFVTSSYNNGTELYKSDGTEIGTLLVKDINTTIVYEKNQPPGPGSSNPSEFIEIDNILYFTANDGINGVQVWKSNGTENGTTMVTGGSLMLSNPQQLTKIDTSLFFSAYTETNGYELWKSDGTDNGTILIADLNLDKDQKRKKDERLGPQLLTSSCGTLFFVERTDSTYESWRLWSLYNSDCKNISSNTNNTISTLKISPNPFDGSATVSINADIADGAEFFLYDMLGKEVRRFEVSTSSFPIERGELSDGVYTLQWLNGNNTISQRLVILR